MWPSEANETHFPFLLRLQRLRQAALLDHPVGVIVVVDLVELPQVEYVGPQAAQALFEVLPRATGVALTVLGHEEDFLAVSPLSKCLAHDLLAAAVVVVPGVVKEGEAVIDGGVHDLDRLVLVLDGANVPTAQANDGNAHARLSQLACRQFLGNVLGMGRCPRQSQRCRAGQCRLQEFTSGVVVLSHGGTSPNWCFGRTSPARRLP